MRIVRHFLVVAFILSLSFSENVAEASDIANALKFAKKVLGDKVPPQYEKYVSAQPDEALALILEQGSLPRDLNRSTVKPKQSSSAAFRKLGKTRLTPKALLPIIEMASRESGLPPELIDAVVSTESGYRPSAVSKTGAKGLMQLMPKTAASLGVKNPFDPAENVRAGATYLRRMLEKFGRVSLALAAYNAGPGNVRKYKGIPPFAETERYVQVVWQRYQYRLKNKNYVNKEPRTAVNEDDEPLRPTVYE
ncbi:MAG: lytic transglycosylase domain-containing protein [Myxococcota bacterium]|nr:lytic transglycosylase domain-containing protein [Myxococcota bacterium]